MTHDWIYSELRYISHRNGMSPLKFLFLGFFSIIFYNIGSTYNRIKYGKKQDEIKAESVKHYTDLEAQEKGDI